MEYDRSDVTSGGIPKSWRPTGPLAPRRVKITAQQREQIREEYREALADEPGLSKLEFARRTAQRYDVAGSYIRHILSSEG